MEQARKRAAALASSEPDDPVEWIESQFWIPELFGPIKLMPYHRAVLREAYRRDADGKFVYSAVVWSDIKKSSKSSIAAAVALERARKLPWGSIKIVANDLKQADSRVAMYARRAIELNPALRERVSQRHYHIKFPNHATIEAIPVDPSGEAGGNDDLIIFSELWAAKNLASQRMWTEMTLSPTKMGYSQRWIETYAGFSGESIILEQLYEQGVREGRQLDLSFTDADGDHDLSDLEVYANDAARLLVLWNTKPRCTWQTKDYYAQESAILAPSEYLRVHENKWATSEQAFLDDMQWWDACQVAPGSLPPMKPMQNIVIALDAAVSSDCFGIVAVTRTGELTQVRYARKWTPKNGEKLLYSNPEDKHDTAYPLGEVRRLCKQYNVIKVVYDEYQLHQPTMELRRENIAAFKKFEQGADRLISDKHLYDMIRERKMQHQGEVDLRQHIQNANRKDDNERMRIVKRSDLLKIDLAVALSMATYEAKRLNL